MQPSCITVLKLRVTVEGGSSELYPMANYSFKYSMNTHNFILLSIYIDNVKCPQAVC